jgi:hypothetical protein
MEYLYGSQDLHVVLKSEGKINTVCFVDASFMTHPDTRSHTGFAVYLDNCGSGAVLAKSLMQKTIAESTMESELIALDEAKRIFLWIIGLTDELVGERADGRTIYEDNQAAIAAVMDDKAKFRGQSRYIDRKFFAISEQLKDGTLKIKYIGTKEQIADYLTKNLDGASFLKFRIELLGTIEQSDTIRGVSPSGNMSARLEELKTSAQDIEKTGPPA